MAGGIGSKSTIGLAIGITFAVIGIIGRFVFGWRFSDPTAGAHPGVGVTLGVIAAIVAVGSVLYRRFAR